MQGIVFDIKRFAVHDGPGIRTTVFFKGCPLNCLWCHNPEGIDPEPICAAKKVKLDGQEFDHVETAGQIMDSKDIIKQLVRDRLFMEDSGGGVTFSGGEPTFQSEFLLSLLQECKKESIHTAVDTSGFASQNIYNDILPFTDIFLFDVKHANPQKYLEGTGVSLKPVIENLTFILSKGKRVRIRIPVIPGFNFNENDMIDILLLIKSLPGNVEQIDLLPYHTIARNKYKRFGLENRMPENVKGLKKEDLQPFVTLFEQGGFRVKIGG
jgi:pyruvate formate lyase activating enzyme